MIGWQDWHFAQPAWFWLLLAWPLIQLMLKPWQGRLDEPSRLAVFVHPRIAAFMQNQKSRAQKPAASRLNRLGYQLSFILKLGIILTLLAALAQPQHWVEQPPQQSQQPVRDIALVVESSVSFVLEDYQLDGQAASRMEVVKSVLDQFISGLEANRFSLSLYAEQAYTLVPMTDDSQAVQVSLQRLQPYLAGRTDEAMGEALGLALRELAMVEGEVTKKIVVLVSDGLQRPSRIALEAIIDYAQSLAVPIYTIGIGAGSIEADQRQHSGLIYQPIETASLRLLASQTGGQFYQVGGGEQLAQVLQQIERSEGVRVQLSTDTRWVANDLYHYPLSGALALFLIWWLLTLGGRQWNY